MNLHSVMHDLFCHVIVLVPQESQVVTVVLSHQEAVKQLLYICQKGNLDFAAKPHQNSKQESKLFRSGLVRIPSLTETPQYLELESNTTLIWPGFCGWNAAKAGRYQHSSLCPSGGGSSA